MALSDSIGDKRIKLAIPFSVLEIIDREIAHRVGDGEHNVTRPSIALEMLKIGARVKKKQLDNLETGANPFDNRLEEQLSFIANKVAKTDLSIRRFIRLFVISQEVEKDLIEKVKSDAILSNEEKTVLARLFVEIEELKEELGFKK